MRMARQSPTPDKADHSDPWVPRIRGRLSHRPARPTMPVEVLFTSLQGGAGGARPGVGRAGGGRRLGPP